jgi:hypothetical protein
MPRRYPADNRGRSIEADGSERAGTAAARRVVDTCAGAFGTPAAWIARSDPPLAQGDASRPRGHRRTRICLCIGATRRSIPRWRRAIGK